MGLKDKLARAESKKSKKELTDIAESKEEGKAGKAKRKLPLFERLFKKWKLKKPGMVAVLFLRNNGMADFMEVESKKGFLNVEGHVYHERRDCTYTTTKDRYPLAIIPEWSLIPVGTKEWEDKTMITKFAELQDHTLRGIRHAELVKMGDKDKPKINSKAAIGIGIAIVVGLAILVGYLK